MFASHFAVGFAAKRWAPRVSLGTLFLGAQFIDLLWPTFLLLGIEDVRIEPGAHLASLGDAGRFAALAWLERHGQRA